jgi:hypothetical protein
MLNLIIAATQKEEYAVCMVPFISRHTAGSRVVFFLPLPQLLKSIDEIFDNPGGDCINVLLQVSPQESINWS